jgi:NADH-quinone oxidoreductase subunit I
MKAYFQALWEGIQSTRKGMALTWKHTWAARRQRTIQNIQDPDYFNQNAGIVTLQYPQQQIPTPVNVATNCIMKWTIVSSATNV